MAWTSFTPARAQLQIQGSALLSDLVQHTRLLLDGLPAQNGQQLWWFVTAHLRLGAADRARQLLRDYQGCDEPDLVLAAFATMRQATGEHLLSAQRRLDLQTALQALEQQPFATFATGALQVHGRLCLAQLDDQQQQARHERLAVARLLQLESETWQPGRGHYRPLPCHGELLVPAAADDSLLQPLSYGMLLASGDRLKRHLDNTLRAAHSGSKLRWHAANKPDETAALRLLAAAQLGDAAMLRVLFAEVAQQRATDATIAARNLDAALQTVSGMRLAAGFASNQNWLRMTPWLPPDLVQLELQGMLAQGSQFAVHLRQDRKHEALMVEVQLQASDASDVPLVVSNSWQQVVGRVATQQPFRCQLPVAAKANQSLPPHEEANHQPADGLARQSGA